MLRQYSDTNTQSYASLFDRIAEMSFNDYKIDYDCRLGDGTYGVVYGVAPRPENEKGFLASVFPYVYDYIFPVPPAVFPSTEYCVKIFKSVFNIYTLNPTLNFIKEVLALPKAEIEDNRLFRKHNISDIRFFKTVSFGYASQFKTLVQGYTLRHYFLDYQLMADYRFALRKGLVKLFTDISNSPLVIADMHDQNFMYDEIKMRWEIIDGAAEESTSPIDPLAFISGFAGHESIYQTLLAILFYIAKNNIAYTESFDRVLVEKIYRFEENEIRLTYSHLRDSVRIADTDKTGAFLLELDSILALREHLKSHENIAQTMRM